MNLDLVPQIFYDLIARVIPGFVLILAWYLTVRGPNKALREMIRILSNQNLTNFWSLSLLIVVSYVLGFILKELWSLTIQNLISKRTIKNRRKYKNDAIAQYNRARKCLGKPALGFKRKELPATHTMFDDVRRDSSSEGHRLLKLQAEAHLCEALFTGFVLLPIINTVLWYKELTVFMFDRTVWALAQQREIACIVQLGAFILHRAVWELALVVVLVSLWRARKRSAQFYAGGTYGAWLALRFPIDAQESTDKEESN